MRDRSFFAKLRDAILGPPLPAHLQTRTVVPLHVRVWNLIRPPQSAGGPGLNQSQGRMIRVALSVAALLIAGAGVYFYMFSGREERSAAALQEGLKSVARVDYQDSVRHFTEAISIWPGNALAYLHRGNSRSVLGETAEAKRDWDTATQLNPGLSEAYTARGTQYRIEGNTQQAIAELSRSLELRPSVDAYYQRGQLYATQQEYQKAIQDFDRSIAERPDAPYVYRARSAARRAIGDRTGADEDTATAGRIENSLSKAR